MAKYFLISVLALFASSCHNPVEPSIAAIIVSCPFIERGAVIQCAAVAVTPGGTTFPVTTLAIWHSSDPKVADFGPHGLLGINRAGLTTVSATYAGITGSTLVIIP